MTAPAAPEGHRYILMKNPPASASRGEQVAQAAANYLTAALPNAIVRRAGNPPGAMTERPQILVDIPRTTSSDDEEGSIDLRGVRGALIISMRIRRNDSAPNGLDELRKMIHAALTTPSEWWLPSWANMESAAGVGFEKSDLVDDKGGAIESAEAEYGVVWERPFNEI